MNPSLINKNTKKKRKIINHLLEGYQNKPIRKIIHTKIKIHATAKRNLKVSKKNY
jgi:hypothetical protein